MTQLLKSNKIDGDAKVCITTLQRLYSILTGKELDPAEEEDSLFGKSRDNIDVKVEYNKEVPIGTFDFLVVDECYRSIYSKWRPVIEYFDAFVVGLTATPSKQTLGFFSQNLVMEFNHGRAVQENINVGLMFGE